MSTAETYVGSADFWNTLVSSIVGLFLGGVTVWATLRSSSPKRRVAWTEYSNQSLIPKISTGAASPVTISHALNTGPLTEARLVELKIRNAGRRDVEQNDFTLGDDSLTFDFGVNIEMVLDNSSDPPSAPSPTAITSGTVLKVWKVPMIRGQQVSYSVLVNGPERQVKLKTAALLNTPVKKERPDKKERRMLFVFFTVMTVAVVALSSLLFISKDPDSVDRKISHIQNCRYWDVHDPTRAKKECPPIKRP